MQLQEWKAGQPGLTVPALAALCGVKRNAMILILHGRTIPRRSTMERIVTVTGGLVTLNDIYQANAAHHNSERSTKCA
jgi:hypothetical protein